MRQYPGKYSSGEAIHIYLLLRRERVEIAVLLNGYYTGHFVYSEDTMSKNYAIEARSLNIMGAWSHNYWILRHPSGEVMAELHGLATDRNSRQFVPIGTSDLHSLRAWHFVSTKYLGEVGVPAHNRDENSFYEEGQRASTVLAGPVNAIMPRWRTAAKAIDFINSLDFKYPPGGISFMGKTLNSNSMFTSFGDVMGLPRFHFRGLIEPGIDNPVLFPDFVDYVQGTSGEVWDGPVHTPAPAPAMPTNNSPAVMTPSNPHRRGGGSSRGRTHFEAGAGVPVTNGGRGPRIRTPFIEYHDAQGRLHRFLAE